MEPTSIPPLPELPSAAELVPEFTFYLAPSAGSIWLTLAPFIALLGTLLVIAQKQRADSKQHLLHSRSQQAVDRDHWWQRCTWALEQSLAPSSEASQLLGLTLLKVLLEEDNVPDKDHALVSEVLAPYVEDPVSFSSEVAAETEYNEDGELGDGDD